MINTFGLEVTLAVNATVPATQVSYRVSGPLGVLQDWNTFYLDPVKNPTPGQIVLAIDGLLNEVTYPQNSTITDAYDSSVTLKYAPEGRVVEVQLLNDLEAVVQDFTLDYVLSGGLDSLVVMGNTFQTYAEAVGNAYSFMDLKSWPSADSGARLQALISSFYALVRLSYDLYEDFNDVDQKYRAGWGFYNFDQIMNLTEYTSTQFNMLRPDFVATLKKAQVVEADARMTQDPIFDARANGITSEVIGPSSTTYRTTKPLYSSIDKRTIAVLGGFFNRSPRLTRL